MIHSISSSDQRFKTVNFRSGLNILLAERHDDASETDTRNGAGKSSLVLLLHFLLGANVGKNSIFASEALSTSRFSMDFDLNGVRTTVSRSGATPGALSVSSPTARRDGQLDVGPSSDIVKPSDWLAMLRRSWFKLEGEDGPSARSLLSYFARRVDDGGFQDAFKQSYQQTPSDFQVAVSYLLGLDWKLAGRWDDVREQEKTVQALANALKEGRLGSYTVGSVAKLRTEVALAEAKVATLRSNVGDFRVVDSFHELEREANTLSNQVHRLANENAIDRSMADQIRSTYEVETPPSVEDLTMMYEAAGVQLGQLVRRRFEEVAQFHESIVENRTRHLQEQLRQTELRISQREAEQRELDDRRAEILRTLRSGGALAELSGLQEELGKAQARLEGLRASYKIADQLAVGKAGVRKARQDLHVALQEDQREREAQLSELVLRFEEFSAQLYEERVGSLEIGASENGPTFSIAIPSGKSKGIQNMQVFCFDLLVAEICAKRGIGPRFLVHDSHLFDGVDERQVARGLALADEISTLNDFQYIVTMNSDSVPTTLPEGFTPDEHFLDVQLTDEREDGGLFGFRF